MRFLRIALPLVVAISGCGTTARNADVSQGLTGLSGRTAVVADETNVVVADSGPSVAEGGRKVSGLSCKNKIWDPAPSRDNAIALMKRQAAELGYATVHSVQVRNDPSAIAKNCWSAIIAEGIAA